MRILKQRLCLKNLHRSLFLFLLWLLDILNNLKFSTAKIFASDADAKGLSIADTDEIATLSLARAQSRLVLQGRGNMCLDAQDFKNWVLKIYGKYAEFSLYGDFEKSVSR